MQLYTPSTEQELVQIEKQVQEALVSTVDFHLKRPKKLRELTCRILGFSNGYQQLKPLMSGPGRLTDTPLSRADKKRAEFLEWLRTTTEEILSIRELHGAKSRDVEQFLVEIMDEVVYDWCGTGRHVSDAINNQGLDAQVEAVVEAGGDTYQHIIEALADEMPEMRAEPYRWVSWEQDTKEIPEGMIVYRDEESGEWAWNHLEAQVHSRDFLDPERPDESRTFARRSEAIEDANRFANGLFHL